MARKGNKSGSMHIKRRTEGTSNEISFSVLDAKSNTAPQASNSPRTISQLGKVSLFTVPGKQQSGDSSGQTVVLSGASRSYKGSATLAGGTTLGGMSAEVANRKHRRTLARVLNVVGVVAILAALGVVGFNALTAMLERQHVGEISLAAGVSMLEQTDAAVIALDAAVSAPATEDQVAVNKLFSDLAAAGSLLDRASAAAEDAVTQDAEDSIREGSSIIKEAASARKALIEQGRLILEQGLTAKEATALVEQAWGVTLQADDYSRRAVDKAEQETAQSFAESSELSNEALILFQDALVLLRQAKTAYPQADFTRYEDYLEKRAAAQQNAIVSNAALQEQDRSIGSANIAAYNEAESNAAAIAAQLPSNPAQPIVDVYEQIGGQADASYQEARVRAARADAEVRELRENLG